MMSFFDAISLFTIYFFNRGINFVQEYGSIWFFKAMRLGCVCTCKHVSLHPTYDHFVYFLAPSVPIRGHFTIQLTFIYHNEVRVKCRLLGTDLPFLILHSGGLISSVLARLMFIHCLSGRLLGQNIRLRIRQ